MSRLPKPGGDNGTWGKILNDFLNTAHNTDGTIKAAALEDAGIASKTYVNDTIAAKTTPEASATIKGIVQLAGDLGGTADSPTVPTLQGKADIAGAETITGTWNFQTEPSVKGVPLTAAFMPSLQQYGPSLMVSPIPVLCYRDTGNVGTANRGLFARVVVPENGTLAHIGINIVTSSGNVDVGIYSIGSTCEKLYSTGTVPCPSAGWQVVGNPQLSVTADQELLFIITCDNLTATFGRLAYSGTLASFPAVWSAEIGGIWAGAITTVMPLPQTILASNLQNNPSIPAIAAKLIRT